jgi:hypothetical protein
MQAFPYPGLERRRITNHDIRVALRGQWGYFVRNGWHVSDMQSSLGQ